MASDDDVKEARNISVEMTADYMAPLRHLGTGEYTKEKHLELTLRVISLRAALIAAQLMLEAQGGEIPSDDAAGYLAWLGAEECERRAAQTKGTT